MDNVYTGKTMTVAHGAVTLGGLRTVTVKDAGPDAAAMLDATAAGDTGYVESAEPMGGEGQAKATITVSALDSAAGTAVALPQGVSIAVNTSDSVVFITASAASSNVGTLAGAELTSRTTTISFDKPSMQELVFEAPANVVWSSV
jgi:hypothetical protein